MILHKKIGIIGCGVNGLSVAYLLQKKGYHVSVISKHHPFNDSIDPAFASLFPAASVIPHSVSGQNIEELFNTSQAFFNELHQASFPGLSVFRHYELFADPKELPWYKRSMDDFLTLKDFENDFYPTHPDIKVRSGWKFNCFFADWKLYYPALFKKVFADNATLTIRALSADDISSLPFDILINCGGLEGAELFGDDDNLLYRGHLLSILDAPKLKGNNDQTISYNFSPGKDIYATLDGIPQDVYCYSRNDGWVFGGSRQKGVLDAQGNWCGDKTAEPRQDLDGISFPAAILDLNAAIIENSFGIRVQDFPKRAVKVAYRFVRSAENGLRLDAEEKFGKQIIHNYGHGGAGVTLSWGCAKKIIELIES